MARRRPNLMELVLAGAAQAIPNFLQAKNVRRQQEQAEQDRADAKTRQDALDEERRQDREDQKRQRQAQLALGALKYAPPEQQGELLKRSVDLDSGAAHVNPALGGMSPAQRSTQSSLADLSLKGFADASGQAIPRERTPQYGSALEGITLDPAAAGERDWLMDLALREFTRHPDAQFSPRDLFRRAQGGPPQPIPSRGLDRSTPLAPFSTADPQDLFVQGTQPVTPLDPFNLADPRVRELWGPTDAEKAAQALDQRERDKALARTKEIEQRGKLALAAKIVGSSATSANAITSARVQRSNALTAQGMGPQEAYAQAVAEYPGAGAVTLEEALLSAGVTEAPTAPAPGVSTATAVPEAPPMAPQVPGGSPADAISALVSGRPEFSLPAAEAAPFDVAAALGAPPEPQWAGVLPTGRQPGLAPTARGFADTLGQAGVATDLAGPASAPFTAPAASAPKPLDQFLMQLAEQGAARLGVAPAPGAAPVPTAPSYGTPLPKVAADIAAKNAQARNADARTAKVNKEVEILLPLQGQQLQARIAQLKGEDPLSQARIYTAYALAGVAQGNLGVAQQRLVQDAWRQSAGLKLDEYKVLLDAAKLNAPDKANVAQELGALSRLVESDAKLQDEGLPGFSPQLMEGVTARLESLAGKLGQPAATPGLTLPAAPQLPPPPTIPPMPTGGFQRAGQVPVLPPVGRVPLGPPSLTLLAPLSGPERQSVKALQQQINPVTRRKYTYAEADRLVREDRPERGTR